MNKHMSVGIMLRQNHKGGISIGGLALHIGFGEGARVNISVPFER